MLTHVSTIRPPTTAALEDATQCQGAVLLLRRPKSRIAYSRANAHSGRAASGRAGGGQTQDGTHNVRSAAEINCAAFELERRRNGSRPAPARPSPHERAS